ncbi:MAG: hypothetical protein ACLQUW_09685 [Desulfobaccales bacterium]
MKIVREIRGDLVNPSISLAVILRKAKILAASLGNQEFRRWVDYELNGYSGDLELPFYRKLNIPVLGNFSAPFGKSVSGYLLPVAAMPDRFKKMANELILGNPIKELESLAGEAKEGLRHPWPTEAVILLRDTIKLSGGYVLIEIYQPIGKPHLDGILDAVRNRLLDFLLALQEIDPKVLDSEEALGKIPSETVSQVYNVTIQGNHNVLASGTGIKQEVTQNFSAYDKQAMMNYLRDIGLANNELKALDQAITADGHPKENKLGKKVTEWLGKMAGKAVTGTWKAAMSATPGLIVKAISKYYGWD